MERRDFLKLLGLSVPAAAVAGVAGAQAPTLPTVLAALQ